jgi:membrane protein DedA with SNARE-associated domain
LKADLIPFLKSLLVVYLTALALSWFVQLYWPPVQKPHQFQNEVVLSVDGDEIEMSYYYLSKPDNERTVLMLPDVVAGADYLLPLAEQLNKVADVIIPVYPEEDTGGNRISHSVEKRALFVFGLTEHLGIESAHLLAHGYGGLPAFNMLAELDPDDAKFSSLALLSSFGPVEMHFMGNRSFNRALYALLYPVLMVGKYAVPHMGWFEQQPLRFSTVRTVRRMDQRTVRPHLSLLNLPVLIMHPAHDFYVSPLVSEEIHRLLPHSTLEMPDASHRDIRGKPEIWSELYTDFLEQFDAGELPLREDAGQERIELAGQPYDPEEMRELSGFPLVLMVILLAVFTIFGEDFATISGGLIVASGLLGFWYVVLACFVGILISDVSIYLIGRWIGKPVLEWRPFKWILKKQDVEKAEQMFRMKGMHIIIAARFVPGSRFPTYLVAGILKTRMPVFLGYFVLAVALWTPFIIGISTIVGTPMLNFIEAYQDYALLIFILIVLIIYLLYTLIAPLTTVTGRRRLIVKWERYKERNF